MKARYLLALATLTLAQIGLFPAKAQAQSLSPFAWKITKPQWSVQDEKNFQEFVARIGAAVESRQCRTVTACLNNPAFNTYRKSDPPGLRYTSDCADFPYILRSYFAWKNGLPFTLAVEMTPRDVPGNTDRDLRYSRYGNVVVKRYSLATSADGKFKNADSLLNNIIADETSSSNYRTHYANDDRVNFTDFYPVAINRDSIHPGTMIYDPNGHVATVYKVSQDGKISYFDAHPDNSITYGTYGSKFVRSNPGQGAGFKYWRPIKLVNATQTAQGYFIGGQIVAASNAQIPDYSIEQFFGNSDQKLADPQWTQGKFYLDGKVADYYDYVRQKMSAGELRLNPVDEFGSILKDVCVSLQDRVQAVDNATRAGLVKQSHPAKLPENIYGTTGDWESFATPSRDAQLKVSFVDLVNQSKAFIEKWKKQDPTIIHAGSTLAQDLMDVYRRESQSCQISYTNSIGQAVTLNLEQIRQRLFKLSFDPYNCVELRWGAQSADELQTCRDDQTKRTWYAREQRLRNQHIRQYDIKMDFNLDDLAKPLSGNGVENPPDVDVMAYLRTQI